MKTNGIFKGWLFDIYPAERGMTLWMIATDDRRIRLTDPYSPSFFVGGPAHALERARESFRMSRLPVSLSMVERRDLWTGRTRSVLRVTLKLLTTFASAVKRVSRIGGVELYNCDIPLEQMYLYEKGLFPLALCEVECLENEAVASIRACNSPWDTDYSLPPLEVLKLYVNGNGANPNHGGRGRGLRVAVHGREYELEEDELLDTFGDMLTRYDPDLILTEWGDSFIIPRLMQMCRRHAHPLPLNREPRRTIGTRRGASYFSYGRIVYRAPARTLFGRWHIDEKNSFIASETGLEGLFELARLTKIPVQRLARTSPGTGISSMQLDTAIQGEVLIPWRKRMPEEFKTALELLVSDKGGLVYLPKPGIYEKVMEIDFASMYPAIMVNHNISPETINCACCQGAPMPEIGYHVCRKRKGLVPRVLKPILDKRRIYKDLSKRAEDAELSTVYERRQTALKWMLVTCFGYLGYKNARFGRIEAHEAVTALGREKLLRAKEIAERKGFELVHAIVDSLWVQKQDMTETDQEELLRKISDAVGISISREGNYRWIAFVPSRTAPNIAVANRYFGLFDTGEMKTRGLETRRSDVPPIVRKMQADMLRTLSSTSNRDEFRQKAPEVLEILKGYLAKLRRGEVPAEDLVIAQKLSKNPSEYKTNTAMAAASKALVTSGVDPRPGERVGMILIDSKAQGQATKSIPYTAGIEGIEAYDAEKYSELLIRAAETILLRRLDKREL
ncbi:MAG: hypothetical protein JSV16_06115 [Candidatus Hydrogenedentota bacterium]|nr:MAG: hypothetical protein JSV16_06115 [Candidatus Hydrogenedentota bacterium]